MQPAVLPFRAKVPSADQSVREVVNLYLAMESGPRAERVRQERGKSYARAWEQIERIARAFRDRCDELKVSQCIKMHLREFIDGRGGSDAAKHGAWGTIQRVFNWATDEMELIGRNPFKGRCPYKKAKSRRPVTDEELQKLLGAAPPCFALFLRFCYFTAARPGEISATRWQDIHGDLNTGIAWIVLDQHKTAEKTGRPRVIGLSPAAIELLLELKKNPTRDGPILRNTRGQAWTRNALTLQMRRLREKLGIAADCKLYGLRHKWATDAIVVHRVPLKDVADQLGHTTVRMTEEHYVHSAGMGARLCQIAGKAAGTQKPDDEPPAAIC